MLEVRILPFKTYKDYHKKFLKIYKNFPEKTKVLDLGCGKGEFIAKLEKKGCEVWGIDFNENAIEIAKKHFNLKRVFATSFNSFFSRENLPQFDIITFFETIEHLDNPLKFIQNVKKLLKPTGKLILSAPCRERFLVNLASWDFPPNHLSRWNEKSIANLFGQVGFKISYVKYLEQFKFLRASINKIELGLVSKAVRISEQKRKRTNFSRIVYLAARLKEYLLATVPAFFLWLISKIGRYKGGTILVELKRRK